MKKKLYKPVLVNLEPALLGALDDLARELNSSRAWLIRRALAEFLDMIPEPEKPQDEADGGRRGH